MSVTVESGFERVRLGGPLRWWLFAVVDGEDGRPQGPRRGASDGGFRFARGGYADTEEAADASIEAAAREARSDLERWRGQPSHALGSAGDLIPLDRVALPS